MSRTCPMRPVVPSGGERVEHGTQREGGGKTGFGEHRQRPPHQGGGLSCMGSRATDYSHREYRQEWSAGCRMDGDVQVGVRQRPQFVGTIVPADQYADFEGFAARRVLGVCHQAGGRHLEKDGTDHGIRVPGCKGQMRDTGAVGLRADRSEAEPHEPVRFAAFAKFFKAYMGTASVVTASLPIPLAAFHYHYYLMVSLTAFSERGVMNATTDLLKSADYREIPDSLQLTVCYLGMFLTAEAAFILMALREYLQDVLKIRDAALIRLPRSRHG